MTYRVVATEIIDDTDRVVFNALDNKLIRRKLCQEMNRAESAESRAAQLETDNDEMQSYINEIRVALHTEKDELTIEAVRRVISERDELARKLEQAQRQNTIRVNGIIRRFRYRRSGDRGGAADE